MTAGGLAEYFLRCDHTIAVNRQCVQLLTRSRGALRPRVSFGGFDSPAYNNAMEISFAPELEAKLNQIASQTGKGTSQIVQELVAHYLDHDQWFRQGVEKGLASLDRGEVVSHEEVRLQIDRILGSQ